MATSSLADLAIASIGAEYETALVVRMDLVGGPATLTLPDDTTGVLSLGWSPDGTRLAALLEVGGGLHLILWANPWRSGGQGSQFWQQLAAYDLGAGIVESAVLRTAWSPAPNDSRLVVTGEFPSAASPAIQDTGELVSNAPLTTPDADDLLGDQLSPTIFLIDGSETPVVKQLPAMGGAFFGGTFAPYGSNFSCATGRELVVLDAATMSLVARLDSFYSAVEPKFVKVSNDEAHEVSLSGLGFTLCHAWSPVGTEPRIAAGNVGGLRMWQAGALLEK
jgi:hypothetical protein